VPIGFGVFQPAIISENCKTTGYLGRTGQVGRADQVFLDNAVLGILSS
jgi:hypothetical protein